MIIQDKLEHITSYQIGFFSMWFAVLQVFLNGNNFDYIEVLYLSIFPADDPNKTVFVSKLYFQQYITGCLICLFIKNGYINKVGHILTRLLIEIFKVFSGFNIVYLFVFTVLNLYKEQTAPFYLVFLIFLFIFGPVGLCSIVDTLNSFKFKKQMNFIKTNFQFFFECLSNALEANCQQLVNQLINIYKL